MSFIHKWIRDLFGFSATEINGFLILIPLMLLIVLSKPVFHSWRAGGPEDTRADSLLLDSLIALWDPAVVPEDSAEQIHYFPFDPNTASVEDLRQLGLNDISAKRIAAYRSKGGVFRVKSDLLKIYGLDSALYNQLYGYIRLPTRVVPVSAREGITATPRPRVPKKTEVNPAFDINTADTLLLKSVYGIGSTLAARIVKFRDALGGFVRPEQFYEVYGLDSMVVNELRRVTFIKDGFMPQKINLNTADEKQFAAHPYIRFKLARLLVSYRFQHGDFLQASDIKKLSTIKPEEMERLLPYLKVTDQE